VECCTVLANGEAVHNLRVLIVIVNYKTAQLTINCLESLQPEIAALRGVQVAVVENGSGDAEILGAAIRDRVWTDWVQLTVSERNGGFAYGNNLAIRPALESASPPDYVILLNSDTEVFPRAIRTLLEFMQSRPDVGIAGSSFENADGTDWPIAFRFITALSELEHGMRLGLVSRLLKNHCVARTMGKETASVDWVAGACMAIRRKVFQDIGLLDEGYFLYFEEVDFCLRARRAGWPCWYVPQSRVMHIAGQSSNVTRRNEKPPRLPAYHFQSRRRYFLKHFGLGHAIVADLAFAVGYASWRVRRWVQRKPDNDPPHLLSDFLHHSVLFPRNRTDAARLREPSRPAPSAHRKPADFIMR
jgi:GT2 family glycosyltransferase